MVLALLLDEGLAMGVSGLVDEPFAVPAHWRVEAANGLLVAERRNRIGYAEAVLLFPALLALPAQVDDEGLNNETALFLARRYRLIPATACFDS